MQEREGGGRERKLVHMSEHLTLAKGILQPVFTLAFAKDQLLPSGQSNKDTANESLVCPEALQCSAFVLRDPQASHAHRTQGADHMKLPQLLLQEASCDRATCQEKHTLVTADSLEMAVSTRGL